MEPETTSTLKNIILFVLFTCFLFCGNDVLSQANSIRTGATFNWADTQPTINDPATIESIQIDENVYSTFVVPSAYELTRLGPGGHNGNNIRQNGFELVGSSNDANWNALALSAYQSLNLNHYFESNSNGADFCNDFSAVSSTNTQIQTITYSPGIPSNPNGVLAVTERGGNNCFYIEVWGNPVGGGPEQQLGQTFVRNQGNLTGNRPQAEPLPNSDYWSSGRNNDDSGQIIGIALYQLSELAPVGSTITSIRYYAATTDNGDGKFFLMQTYAQDDSFNPEFDEVFNGDAGANDNVPNGSSYTYFSATDPFNGSVVVNNDGTFTYTPNPGFTGTDTFEIQVCLPAPNQNVCDTSTVTLSVKSGVNINDATAEEGDNLTYTISINDAINEDVEFNITYSDNSTTNTDYNGPSTIILPANATSVTFDVAATDDTIIEPTETFNVTIDNPSAIVTILDGDGNGTILDNDAIGNGVSFENTNITVTEGTNTFARFTVVFNGTIAPGQNVTVDYTTADGTALNGSDYSAQTGTLTFNNTNTSFNIDVLITDDMVIEPTEAFSIVLSNVQSNIGVGLIGPDTAVGTINDNDGGAGTGVSVSDFTVNEDAGTATFDVSLNADVQGGFAVDFTVADGSAIAPGDYTVASASGTLNFIGNNGEVQTVTVTILDDTLIEGTEDMNITLSGLTSTLINIVDANGLGTINDNDGGAGTGVSVSDFTVNEDAGTATFEVSLNADVQGGFAVDFTVADGSAIAPGDYTLANASGTLNFAGTNGEVQTITINIIDDTLIEGTENLNITLSGLTSTLINIVDANGLGTINDNDGGAGIGVSVSDFTVDEDAGTATFEVSLNADVQGGFAVDFTVADGSAIAPGDYTVANASGTLNFAGTNGEVQTITINIIDDTLIEGTEDMNITLSGLTSTLINIVDANGLGTINDNDGGAGIGVSVSDFTVDEDAGTATFEVSLNADVQGGFAVDFTVADGSAIAPGDYTVANASGTLNFIGNNNEVQTITINIIDDTLIEGTEDMNITLSGLTSTLINIVDANGLGTINDNDGGAGTGVSVSDFTVDEDAGTATFEVSLNADVQGGFAVDFTVADGSAIAPGDYTVANASGTLNFIGNNGEVQTVTVTILDDTLIEGTEDMNITLSGLTSALINIVDANGLGTITDNDGGAGTGVSVSDFTVDEDAGTATFEVSLNADVQGGFAVDFTVADGSAIAPGDYTLANASGTLNFTGNNNEVQTVTVNIIDDALIEGTEDLNITLSGLTSTLINIVDANGLGTITDNDGGAGTGVSVSDFTVNEDAGTATFDISLNADVQGGFAVDFTVADGSAIAPGDYTVTSASGTLNFIGNNNEVQTVTVTILDDSLIEGAEDLNITLSGLTSTLINIVDANGLGTINDNDGGAGTGVSVSDFTVNEDAGTATFEVSLNADVQGGFAVDFTVADGSAIAPGDYTLANASGTLNFAGTNGEVQTITINIIDDTLIEGTENLNITLSGLTSTLINIVDANGLGTINDNDGGAGIGVSVSDFTVDEDAGTATFEVSLNADVQGGFAVDFTVADGSAIAPGDYTVANASGTLNFAGTNGEVQTITINIIDDTLIEGTEDMNITLSGLTSTLINIVDANGLGTINDNDGGAGIGVSVSDFTVDEDAGTATFEVSLNADVQGGFAVDFTVADGSAIAPGDYTVANASGTLNFIGNNNEVQTITINIIDDTLIEGTEDMNITLSGLTSTLINIVDANGLGTINDNDGGAGTGVSVSDFTVDEDAGTATFEVSLNADVQGGFAVDFTVADGSAIAPGDYTVANASGTLNFIGNNGEVQTVTVTILDDTLIEGTEDMNITLSGLTSALINIVDANGLGTITDNDGGAGTGVSVSDFTVDEDAGTATFEVSLNADVQGGFAVDFTVADGSAIAPGDYTLANASGTLNFTGNNNEVQTVTVNIIDDALIEGTEDLNITLSGLTSTLINIVDANGLGTITDNDGGAGTGVSVSDFTVNEDAGTATFDISLNADVQGGFAVDFTVADGSAIAPGDYTVTSASGTLNFIGNNNEVQTVTVTILDDSLIEGAEDLNITLSGLTSALINIVDANGLGTITDNDGGAGTGVSVSDFTVDEDAGTATFEVSLNADVQGGFAVDFTVADGSAIAPGDYTLANASGTLNFIGNNGEVQTVTINIIDDTLIEGAEDMNITLSGLTSALINIVDANGLGTITDNDGGAGTGVSVSDFTVDEDAGTATFEVSLNADVQGGFAVDFTVADGSAIAPGDYTLANASGTLNFTGNNNEVQTVTVNIIDDALIEGTEDLNITLSGLTSTLINIVDANGLGTITDNDGGAGTGVSVSDFTVNEDAGTATFDISLNADVQGGFAVDFTVADGSAIAPGDYTVTSASGTLNFIGNNNEVQTVTVTILDDSLIEGAEDLNITLSGLTSTLINIVDANGLGTITDNDGGAGTGVSVSDFTVNEDAGTATFEVSLNADVQGGFAVDFTVADGSAIAPGDYTVTSASGTLNFIGNNNEVQTVTVTILDDSLIEGAEDLNITLSGLTSTLINIVDANGLGTINDNDGGAGIGVSVSDFTVDEDAGTATFEVSLNADVQGGFAVDFTVADGSAIAPGDYTVANASGTLNFAGTNGEVQTITINIIDDTLIEGTEDMNITLSGLTSTLINIVDANGLGTINDNDGGAGIGVSVSDFTVDEDAGTATFDISLNADVQGGFAVDFTVADGSAIAPGDYTVASASGTLNFIGNNGEVQTVTVTILDDTLIEGAEDLSITLSGLTSTLINIVDANGLGTINDNDGGAGTGVSVSDFTVNEDAGTATFSVSLNADVQGGFTVDFTVADGSAIAPGDYTLANASGTLNFTGNNNEVQTVTVNIIDDALIEGTENLNITLSGLTSTLINIVDANGLGTINDNDGNGPTEGIAVSDFIVNEDVGTVDFIVSYTGNTIQNGFNVNFNVTDGSAIDPDDYSVANTDTFVTFPDGTVSGDTQLVTINIVDDMLIETLETLDIALAFDAVPPVGVNMLDGAGIGTITDNDGNGPTEGIAVSDFIVNEDVGTVDFIVSYTGNTVQNGFNVNFNVTDNTAINPDDYTVANTDVFVTFPANTASGDTQVVTINIVDDMLIETLETLDVALAFDAVPPVGINMLDDVGIGTITDNDANGPTEGIAVSDFTVNEDVGTVDFVVSYTGNTIQNGFNVNFNVTDNTAINPDDYTVANTDTFVTFPDGTVSGATQLVTINIVDDMLIETLETLDISLSFDAVPPVGINMLDGAGIGTITDNDGNGPTEGIAVSDFTVNEDVGTVDFIVSYTGNTVQNGFNVNFNVTDGTAINPDDYNIVSATGTLVFPANTTNGDSQTITVNIIDDMISEMAETLDITLTFDAVPPIGVNMLDGEGVGTILDNDISAEPYEEELTILCGEELPPVPDLTFIGGCGDYDVVFNEETEFSNDSDDYMVIRTWNVTDSCGNTASFQQIVFVLQPQLEEVFIDICVEDEPIDLINYLPEGFDTNGTFEVEREGTYLNNTTFVPFGLEIGEYKIMYSSTDGTCKYYVDFYITVNKDCVPCNRDEIVVSDAVTVNGDGINDFFEIKGVEYCEFTFDVMIFNRWGDKVFEANDYQNDWGGFAPNNAVGSSGLVPAGTYYYIISINDGEQPLEPINGYIYVGTE